MTHLEHAKLYLSGLEATQSLLLNWKGDIRNKPKYDMLGLVREKLRVMLIINEMENGQ
jgi:hypothetical protein